MFGKSEIKVHLLLLSVVVSNAFNYSISKIVMNGFIDPNSIILIRIACTSVFFWAISYILNLNETPDKTDYKNIAICSLLGISINQMLFYNGLNKTTPINASVMTLMTPIIIFLINFLVHREKTAWWQIIGVCTACLGAALLLINKGLSFSKDTLCGDLLILANSTVYAIFVVLVAPLMQKYHPINVMKWIFTLGFPVVLPIAFGNFVYIKWDSLTLAPWLSLGFIVFLGTIYNYYINTWSLRHVSPSVNGAYIYLIPFMASLVAVFMKKDVLTLHKITCGALIIIGVFLVSKKSNVK